MVLNHFYSCTLLHCMGIHILFNQLPIDNNLGFPNNLGFFILLLLLGFFGFCFAITNSASMNSLVHF